MFLSLLAAGIASAALSATAMEFGPRAFGQAGWLSGTGAQLPESESLFIAQQSALFSSESIAPSVNSNLAYVDNPDQFFVQPAITKVKLPGGTLTSLKGNKPYMALTVDDGVSSAVVREYALFAQRTGMRLTFFVTASYPSWSENTSLLRPLVESGQIQLANHSWSHPDLKKQSDAKIADELTRAQQFLSNTYGVDARPYFRPPYGSHDGRVDKVAASLGYTTPVIWDGTLSDSALIPAPTLKDFAKKYIQPERIVLGHANAPTVTECFDYIRELVTARQITPVTLNDLYLRA